MPREIIRISMEQLPHISSHDPSSSGSSSGSYSGLTHHSTRIVILPNAPASASPQGHNAEASSSQTQTGPPRLPQRPSFSRRQRYIPKQSTTNPAFSQLASHIAKVQAQPHKPKRPSPLHVSVSPTSPEEEELSDSPMEEGGSPEVPDWREKVGLSPIVEEKGNMLGLDLDGWSWTCELQERMKEPKTPFPSPAILM